MQSFEVSSGYSSIDEQDDKKKTLKRAALVLLILATVVLGTTAVTRSSGVATVDTKVKVGQKGFNRPNIIHIFIDDAGLQDMGYGGAPWKTPTIDRMAKNGMVLDAHRVFPSCSPTRMAFMTGRLPYEFGVTHAGYMTAYELPPEAVLPELLNSAGYRSFGFGKWHSGRASHFSQPTSRGFTTWTGFTPGFITQSKLVTEAPWALFTLAGLTPQEMGRMRNTSAAFGLYAWEENAKIKRLPITKSTWADDLATDGAIKSLDTCDVANGKPCFIYLNFGSPHAPIEKTKLTKQEKKRCKNVPRYARRVYCGMIQKIDSNMRRLVKKLQSTKKWKDTLIVITSDNGGLPDVAAGNEPYLWDGYGSNLPYRGTKATVFEGGIKTRAIVSGGYATEQFCRFSLGKGDLCSNPKKARGIVKKFRQKKLGGKGIRRKGLVSVQDWYATYTALAGVQRKQLPIQVDGVNQFDHLFGGFPSPRTEYTAIGGRTPTGKPVAGVIASGKMKMVWLPAVTKFVKKASKMGWRPGATLDGYWNVDADPSIRTPAADETSPIMLFDLSKDPTEKVNVYNNKKYAGVRATMQARMDEIIKIFTADPFHIQPQGIYASVQEGYIVTPWEDNPNYSSYSGTLRESLLYWADQVDKSKGGALVMKAIESIAKEEVSIDVD